MPENIYQEVEAPKERQVSKYTLHFEPGTHPFPGADIFLNHPTAKEIKKRFLSGDLTVHAWNPELAQRMRGYSPLVLGLDSVPGRDFTGEFYIGEGWKWPWLPGSPKDMSRRDMMYLVGGDMLHQYVYASNQGAEAGWGRVEEYAKKWFAEQAATLALPLLIPLLLKKLDQEGSISRREFFQKMWKGVKYGVGAMALGRLVPIFLQAYSPTAKTEGLASAVTRITKPISSSEWLDGRTALIITKTQEAMEFLDLPSGTQASIVMGSPHAYGAYGLLTNIKARMEVIKKYAIQLANDMYSGIPDNWWDNYLKAGEITSKEESEKRSFIMNAVLSELTLAEVYEVHQPKSDYTDDPIGTSGDLIKSKGWFRSPEVIKAVSSLGDPMRFTKYDDPKTQILLPKDKH